MHHRPPPTATSHEQFKTSWTAPSRDFNAKINFKTATQRTCPTSQHNMHYCNSNPDPTSMVLKPYSNPDPKVRVAKALVPVATTCASLPACSSSTTVETSRQALAPSCQCPQLVKHPRTGACCVTGTQNSLYTVQCDGVGVAPKSVSHRNLHWSYPSYLLHETSGGGGEGMLDKYPPTVFTIDPSDTVYLHTYIYTLAPTPTLPSTTPPTCPRL